MRLGFRVRVWVRGSAQAAAGEELLEPEEPPEPPEPPDFDDEEVDEEDEVLEEDPPSDFELLEPEPEPEPESDFPADGALELDELLRLSVR